MADKLPPGHGVEAHKDKMGKVMHEFKRGQLHSGTGKKGKKGKVVKSREQAIAIGISESKHAEQLMAMGYSEEAAFAVASFIESQRAADDANEGPLSDIDSTPGKQRGNSGRRKQEPQDKVATFPTLPKQAPGSGYAEGDAPTAAARAIEATPCEQKRKREPQVVKPPEQAKPTQPTQPEQPQNQTPAAVAARDAAKARAERCAKNSGTQSNNQISRPQYKEMHQSLEEKRRKIKQLQREGHPASILIKQVRDHD